MKFSVETWFECVRCGQRYALDEVRYNCHCGGILDVTWRMF